MPQADARLCPPGFVKTTLVSEWVQAVGRAAPRIATTWLPLDENHNDPTRVLAYFIAALQTLALSPVEGTRASIGKEELGAPRSPQSPPTKAVLTSSTAGSRAQASGWGLIRHLIA